MILALDTSSAIAVALVDRDAAVASRSVFDPRGHAEHLSGMVDEVLAEAGATRADVSRIVVGTGPAPFTGLRVGLITARMLGAVWSVPVDGVCSLDALGAAHGGEATVVADARRKEVYWATYAGGERLDGPGVCAPGDVPLLGAAVGRGALLYPDAFPGAVGGDPDPVWLARIATARRLGGEPLPSEPLYLRRPDIHGVPARPQQP